MISATLLVTLLEGWPWLRVEKDFSLDSKNPFSETFLVVNGGYLPITNLNANCTVGFIANSPQIKNAHTSDSEIGFQHFAHYLAHDGRATIPCFQSVGIEGPILISEATLIIKINYAFPHADLKLLRPSQKFNFRSIRAKDGSQHWQQIN